MCQGWVQKNTRTLSNGSVMVCLSRRDRAQADARTTCRRPERDAHLWNLLTHCLASRLHNIISSSIKTCF